MMHDGVLKAFQALLPKLCPTRYKGQCGRIGVVGGCKKYTGAPYYAGISSLKLGGDLCSVFCSEEAAIPIKSYSPELMVDPLLRSTAHRDEDVFRRPDLADTYVENVVNSIGESMERLHALVIGPGLGRDEFTLQCVAEVIALARGKQLPLVIDGDGLWLLAQQPMLVHKYPWAVLTPNAIEFQRLWEAACNLQLGLAAEPPDRPTAADLANALGGVTVVRKGHHDEISNGEESVVCETPGSLRRCGGQGDVLAGGLGLFLSWAHATAHATDDPPQERACAPQMVAAYAACHVLRRAANAAFAKHRRSTLTTEIILELEAVLEAEFPV